MSLSKQTKDALPPLAEASQVSPDKQRNKLLQAITSQKISDFAQLLHDAHLVQLATAIHGFRASSDNKARAGYIYAIIGLFTDAPPLTTILLYAQAFPNIEAFFTLLLGTKNNEETVETEITQDDIVPQQALNDGALPTIHFDPKNDAVTFIEGIAAERPILKTWLESNINTIKIICGLITIIAAICGVDGLLRCSQPEHLMKSVVALGNVVRGFTTIQNTLSHGLDSILPVVYSFFGAEYVAPQFARLKTIADKISALYKDSREAVNRMKCDPFGFQIDTVQQLESRYENLNKIFMELTVSEKSQYNFHVQFSQIHADILSLNEIVTDLYKTAGGKQRPVVTWIAGLPNTGKTYITNKLGVELANRHGGSPYDRTWSDEFHSGYHGQPVAKYDDMLQSNEGKDVIEFHRYTSDDQKDTIGAGLNEKGRPFTSKYIIASSNFLWFAPPTPLKEYFALNRRRDIVVYAHNPAVQEYAETHNGTTPEGPEWFAEHPTRYYLINPTYGHTLSHMNAQDNLKFYPKAPYVIREVTYEEILEGSFHLQQWRQEQFRLRLINAATAAKYPIPRDPIQFDPTKFIHIVEGIANGSVHTDEQGNQLHLVDLEILGLDKPIEYVVSNTTSHSDVMRSIFQTENPVDYSGGFTPKSIREAANGSGIQRFLIMKNSQLFGDEVEDWLPSRITSYMSTQQYDAAPVPIINIFEIDEIEYYEPREPDQNNPIRTTVSHKAQPSIMLRGPPGTGKTVLVKNALPDVYVVTYEDNEQIPTDKPILYDDITVDRKRMDIARQAIAAQYEGAKMQLIICTANVDTQVWKDYPQDDKTMMLRRCHDFEMNWSAYTRMTCMARRIEITDYLKQATNREEYVTITPHFHAGNDWMKTLTYSNNVLGDALCRLNKEKVEDLSLEVYSSITLPCPMYPDIKVLLDDSFKPSIFGTKILVRDNGTYRPIKPLESVAATKLFTLLLQRFSDKTIADRRDAPKIVNAAKLPNTTSVKSALVISKEWTIGIETIDGVLMAFHVDHEAPNDYELLSPTAFFFGGRTYQIEDDYDEAVSQLLGRINSIKVPEPAIITLPTSSAAFAETTLPIQLAKSALAIADVAAVLGFSAKILLQEKKAHFERAVYAKVEDHNPEQGSASKKTRPEHRTEIVGGPSYTYERRNHNARDPANNGRKDDTDHGGDENPKTKETHFIPPGGKIRPEAIKSDSDDDLFVPRPKRVRKERKAAYAKDPADNGRRDDTDHGGDNNPKATATRYQAPTAAPQPPKHESKFPKQFDRMAVVLRGSTTDGEYGIAHEGMFTYAHEMTQANSWIVFCRPIDESFLSKDCTVVYRSQNRPDVPLLNALKGKSFTLNPHGEYDFGCMLANYVVKGQPYCETSQRTREDIFDPIRITLPARMSDMTRVAYNKRNTEFQGSFDTQSVTVQRTLYKNRVRICLPEGQTQWGIMLHGRIGITNSHAPKGFFIKEMHGEKEYPVAIMANRVENDIIMFRVLDDKFQQRANIMNHIPTAAALGKYLTETGGKIAINIGLAIPELSCMFAAGEAAKQVVSSVLDRGIIKYQAKIGYFGCTGVTEYGDCGSPVVLMAPTLQAKFVGIHSRGNSDVSIASPISRDYLESMERCAIKQETVAEAKDIVPQQCDEIEYDEVPYQDARVNQLHIGVTKRKVFIPRATQKYRSGLKLEHTHEPTIKSRDDFRNVQGRDLLREALARYQAAEIGDEEREDIKFAAIEVGKYLAAKMVEKDMRTRVITTTESLNGTSTAEFPCSKDIDRGGSAGYPYVQKFPGRNSKGDYLFYNEDHQKWYFRHDEAGQAMLSDTNKLMQQARQGAIPHIPWVVYPKDEVVKLEKIYDLSKQKTRAFFSGPMHYQLAYRRMFGASLWRITELHMEIPIKVGLAPNTLSWHVLAYSHLSVGNEGFASDMKNWDGGVPLEMLEAVPIVHNIIYQATDPNWKPEDDVARLALHKAVQGIVAILNNQVYKLKGSMASGYPGTAIDNSIINWILFFCCWMRIMKKYCPSKANFRDFMLYCRLSAYGDDNMATVAKALLQFFNFNSFKAEAAKFGFNVTDAAKKGGEQPDYVPFEELEFLKRGFNVKTWCYLPVLDKDSINKTLTWITGGRSYTPSREFRVADEHDVFLRSLDNVWSEIAFHGEEYYDEMSHKIREASRGTGMLVLIPSFQEAMSRSEF